MKCKNCDRNFEPTKFKNGRSNKQIYCSTKCANSRADHEYRNGRPQIIGNWYVPQGFKNNVDALLRFRKQMGIRD